LTARTMLTGHPLVQRSALNMWTNRSTVVLLML
jgi:hypothetical protein